MSSICKSCGAKTVSYSHTLSKGIVDGLVKFARLGTGPHRLSEAGLNRNEIDNFQKLKYFGVACKAGDGPKSGIWRITSIGRKFLSGEKSRPKKVRTYRGEVEEVSADRVLVSDIPHDPYYLQWSDYVAESQGRE